MPSLLPSMASPPPPCYYPDGSLSSDLPCDPATANTMCCELGSYCTNTNLCIKRGHLNGTGDVPSDNLYLRGSCTDRRWTSPECFEYCRHDNPQGSENVLYCGNGIFSCAAHRLNSTSCGTDAEAFELEVQIVTGIAGVYTIAPTLTSTSTSMESGAWFEGSGFESGVSSTTGDISMVGSSVSPTGLSTSIVSSHASNGTTGGALTIDGAERKMLRVRVGVAVAVAVTCLLIIIVILSVLWIRKLRLRSDREILRRGVGGLDLPELKLGAKGRGEERGKEGDCT
ncbi:hypothetical protein BDV96DRAFT_78402 [Lophiotrema nucula]|uniref:Mid2 domain-containing protein n=1 Tax=Lophiotrema nucula TaxID=690887 RepID=A0A6A5Z7F6_9PLEO|nr:hypothetical protein BDV96DRAFT_78402 [Lophiotrema nucula]